MTNADITGPFNLHAPENNTWAAFSLALIASWVRSWLTSGCVVESLVLVAAPAENWSVPRYTLLAILNAAYLLASTSWLFHLLFAALCWPLVVVTCIIQYASVSSFTRGRLRSWLKLLHFYKDKVAFFDLPSLVIDTELDGLVTIRGVTFSILDLSIELHGIEVGLDLGSGHELSIHSDAVTIKLFRQIAIDEVYGVHWFTGDNSGQESREHRADSHADSQPDLTHSPSSKKDAIKERFHPSVEESAAANHQDHVKDRVLPRSQGEKNDIRPEAYSAHVAKNFSRGDVEAEKRYDDVLLELRQSNRLYQSRARVRIAHGSRDHDDQTDESPDTRAAVNADLRSTRPPMSPPSGRITVSRLIAIFEPITRLLDKVPVVLRVTLWLLSQSHPITCPSICFSACGAYLGGELSNKLFRHHAAGDKRIEQLKTEVAGWLSAADVYLDFTRLRGRASVPLRTSSDIRAELSSAAAIITRINPQCEDGASKDNDENTGRVAQLRGADTSFTIPTCLLPSHGYLAPVPESSEQEDTAPISLAIRAQLPAHFSEAVLNFAATLSKTGQMLDIEEEAGLAADDTDHITPRTERLQAERESDNSNESRKSHDQDHQGFRSKLSHGRIGAAIKHPVQHGKQFLHKEVKKTAVDKIDGAWFAKWTNKLLRKMEGLEGDVGYSTEIPTGVKR